MKRKPKRYRIFYSSGIISLTLLPLLCIFYLNKYKVFEIENVLEINYFQKNWISDKKHHYVKEYYKKPNHTINIDGNMTLDHQKMDSIKRFIDTINKYEYATNNILINLKDDAKYGAMIEVLDYLYISDCKRYIFKRNSIMAFNEPKYVYDKRIADEEKSKKREIELGSEKLFPLLCGTGRFSEKEILEFEAQKKATQNKITIQKIYLFYPAWLLLSIMFILTFVRRKIKFENPKI